MNNNKPLPNTPNPDQRASMVKDALDSLSPSFQPDKSNAGEQILTEAMIVAKAVAAIVGPLVKEANTKLGVKHDKVLLSKMIGKAYLEGFGSWSKDDLLYLLVFIHTQIAVESITGETGNSGIVIP
jgi:hypothetical protein